MAKINDSTRYKMKLRIMFFFDVISVVISYFFALWARFDFRVAAIGNAYLNACGYFVIAISVVTVFVYWAFRLYHSVWRFAGMQELYRIVMSYFVIAVAVIFLNYIPFMRLPRGAVLLGYIISLMLCVFLRFGYRIFHNLRSLRTKSHDRTRILIVGAGQVAQEIIKDIRNAHNDEYEIVALVDDNKFKKNRDLEGITVEGNRYDIPDIVKEKRVERIIFAIANAEAKDRKEILNICKDTGCELLAIPSLYQLYTGSISVSKLKHVEIEDLLGRKEISVDLDQIMEHLTGKTIMVTGGGGSIGSELCRQIARANPKELIIFDIYG